jgi:superfamily I DNA and RNA helicase
VFDNVIGPKSDAAAIDLLLERLNSIELTGTAYVGYPLVVLPSGTAAVDLLLTCREHGIVLFDICRGATRLSGESIEARQRELRQALSIALARSGKLIVGGRLIVDVRVLTLDADEAEAPGPPSVQDASETTGSASQAWGGGPRYSLRPQPTSAHGSGGGAPQPVRSSLASRGNRLNGRGAGAVATWSNLMEVLQSAEPIGVATLRHIDSAVQHLDSASPAASRPGMGSLAGPRAAILAEIDAKIANLDRWQKAAAIEMPAGPQRIRGLAGSGKTVVLAWKAAYLHAREPESRIALTFYNRTLYEPLQAMVRRFFRDHTGHDPNWDHLRLLHAWGARSRPGFYSQAAGYVGDSALGIDEAKRKHGSRRVFESLCQGVISKMGPIDPAPLYDVVLIDEAQDLPPAFLEMVYRLTAPPKRIVWAYDDLQNLGEYEPTSPARLFGKGADGLPRVPALIHEEGEARPDIILPICYRNTPWALTTAHALGLGVYRTPTGPWANTGLVQFYDDSDLWSEIGYGVESGRVFPGEHVTLARSSSSTPPYFKELLEPHDAISCHTFADSASEAEWVAGEIAHNLADDGLTARDVLIVSANPFFKVSDSILLTRALTRRNIRSHFAGSGGRVDELFGTEGSVPIAGINRAKGNEAAMVYVVHAEQGADPDKIVRRRNTLFSAITRSRAWVCITGAGEGIRVVEREVEQVIAQGYKLSLSVPTPLEMAGIRKLQRDRSSLMRRPRRTPRRPPR